MGELPRPTQKPNMYKEGLLGYAGLKEQPGNPELITDVSDTKISDTQRFDAEAYRELLASIDFKDLSKLQEGPRENEPWTPEQEALPRYLTKTEKMQLTKNDLAKLSDKDIDVVLAFIDSIGGNGSRIGNLRDVSAQDLIAFALAADRKKQGITQRNASNQLLDKTG